MVSTTGSVTLALTATCPKERLDGVAVRESLVTPVPAKGSWRFEFDVIVNVAALRVHPFAVGAKATFGTTLCPAARTAGRVRPDTVNSDPPILIAEIVALVCPVFVKTVS